MSRKQDHISSQLREAFDKGAAAAIDPTNDAAIQRGGDAITTLQSSWLHQQCPICAHTFRLGDQVIIVDDKTITHQISGLSCPQGRETIAESLSEISNFFVGLDEAWPLPENVSVIRLEIENELLAPPSGAFQRFTCAVCAHTLRLYDQVVICPCSPEQPLCQTAIHRDLIKGLHCLEAWNPEAKKQHYCPVTSRNLNE